MTDDTSRIARLEEKVRSLDQRITGQDKRIDQLAPMLTQVATLNERVATTHANLMILRSDFAKFQEESQDRAEDDRKDKQQFNRWAIGLAITILLGLASVVAVVLASGHHP